MKIPMYKYQALLLLLIFNSSCLNSSENGITYPMVSIGKQKWMSENLNLDTFRNGDLIPEANTEEEWKAATVNKKPACCYYLNRGKGAKYGRLYNWYAVNDKRGLAPSGWHIPSDVEWTTMEMYLQGNVAEKIKSTFGWDSEGAENGTNISGFNGFPGGSRSSFGSFRKCENYPCAEGYWWSSTEYNNDEAWLRNLNNRLNSYSYDKGEGYSVRCIKD